MTNAKGKSVKSAALILFAILGLAVGLATKPAAVARGSADLEVEPPSGVPAETWTNFIPKDNPITRARVDLGRQLFFDKRLSADGTVSCASCHDPAKAFTDGKALAQGIGGRVGKRSSPTILNVVFNGGQFWDGRVESLEAQAGLPLINPDEMGDQTYEQIVSRLNSIPDYVARFRAVFGISGGAGSITIENFEKAVACFERTLVSGNSAYDRYIAGDTSALSDQARHGLALFSSRARCSVCHTINSLFFAGRSYPFFTDQMYHNTGVAANDSRYVEVARQAVTLVRDGAAGEQWVALGGRPGGASLGRFVVTGNSLDIGAFKTPSLRDVELTAPYFHDGSAATLEDVVKYYVKGGNSNPNRDWELQAVTLSSDDQADLIAFLKSLTSDSVREMVEREKSLVFSHSSR